MAKVAQLEATVTAAKATAEIDLSVPPDPERDRLRNVVDEGNSLAGRYLAAGLPVPAELSNALAEARAELAKLDPAKVDPEVKE